LFAGAGEHDGVVKGLRPAERYISLERVHQPRRVHLDELLLGEIRVAAGICGVVLNRGDAAEEHNLTDGLSVMGGPKRCCTSWAKRRQEGVPAVSSSL
jgi:hypothetical protein